MELQKEFAELYRQSDKSKFELQDAIDNLDALSKKDYCRKFDCVRKGVSVCHSLMKTIQLNNYLLIL